MLRRPTLRANTRQPRWIRAVPFTNTSAPSPRGNEAGMAVRLANPMQTNAPGSRCTLAPRSLLTFVPLETRRALPTSTQVRRLAIGG